NSYTYEFYLRDKAGNILSRVVTLNYDRTPPVLRDRAFVYKVEPAKGEDHGGDGIDPLAGYYDSPFATVNIQLNIPNWTVGYGNSLASSYNDGVSESYHGSGIRKRPLFVRLESLTPLNIPGVYASATYPGGHFGAELTANLFAVGIPLTRDAARIIVMMADRAGNVVTLNDTNRVTMDDRMPFGISFNLVDTRDVSGIGIFPVYGFFNHQVITFNIEGSQVDRGLSGLRGNRFVVSTANGIWKNYTYQSRYVDPELKEQNEPGTDSPLIGSLRLPT
ncbi:MAG: hypothetical protein AABZ14_03725, partial [Candidatus Margulisiibacteriota bacterium]